MSTDPKASQSTGPQGPNQQTRGKGFFQSMADGVASGFKVSGDFFVDGGKLLWDGLTDSAKFLLKGLEDTSEMVVDQVTGAVGYIQGGVYYVGGKAVEGTVMIKDGVISVGENIVGSIINTTRFIGDSEYREKVGIPWLKEVISSNRDTLIYQMQQNRKAMDALYRFSMGASLTKEETAEATKQLNDMIKLVPALAIFLVPGGSLLLPILARLLPWEVFPDLRSPEQRAKAEQAAAAAKAQHPPAPSESHEKV